MFPVLEYSRRCQVIALHLDRHPHSENLLAYLIIRNAAYLGYSQAKTLAEKVRLFKSAYLRNRCLLKLAPHLPVGEVDARYQRFIAHFHSSESSVDLIHNLYHFSAVSNILAIDTVLDMALEKIASFDDTQNDLWQQAKYTQLQFITPHLTDLHMRKAFEIAGTVRGGYRKSILARLRRHCSGQAQLCAVRYVPVFIRL
jgi:hypothetical protein